jgi:IPT/TIG domain
MKNRLQLILLLLTIGLMANSCKKKSDTIDNTIDNTILPTIKTGVTSQITQSTATIEGYISYPGTKFIPVPQHGHCWSTNSSPTIENTRTSLGYIKWEDYYTSNITGLTANTTYNVRGYAIVGEHVVYGEPVTFTTMDLPPAITGFNPKAGPIGTLVEINGTRFNPDISRIRVQFGSKEAQVIAATENKITVKVPEITKSELVHITVITSDTGVSAELFDLWFPWSQEKDYVVSNPAVSFSIGNSGYVIEGNALFMSKYDPESDAWLNNQNLPENSGNKPLAFSSGGKAYALLETSFWEFNPITGNWIKKADFPDILQNNRKFVFGMNIGSNIYIGNCAVSLGFWEYIVDQNVWQRKADFIGNFTQTNMVWGNFSFSVNNIGYLGLRLTETVTNNMWEYDPLKDQWSVKSDMPSTALDLTGCFVINGEAFVGLGLTNDVGVGNVDNSIWKYDPQKDQWLNYRNCPVRMAVNASFSIQNKGYIVSAYGHHITQLNNVWGFDPSKN